VQPLAEPSPAQELPSAGGSHQFVAVDNHLPAHEHDLRSAMVSSSSEVIR